MVEEEVAQDRVEDARDVGARALWQQKALLLVHVQLVGLSVSARKRRGGRDERSCGCHIIYSADL